MVGRYFLGIWGEGSPALAGPMGETDVTRDALSALGELTVSQKTQKWKAGSLNALRKIIRCLGFWKRERSLVRYSNGWGWKLFPLRGAGCWGGLGWQGRQGGVWGGRGEGKALGAEGSTGKAPRGRRAPADEPRIMDAWKWPGLTLEMWQPILQSLFLLQDTFSLVKSRDYVLVPTKRSKVSDTWQVCNTYVFNWKWTWAIRPTQFTSFWNNSFYLLKFTVS